MTSNRIPDEISIHRPGPCTEVKLISGHYYVYMYKSVKLASGKWGKKTGKCIGSIIPEKGFVPNKNYSLFEEGESQDEISVLEYGQYALIEDVAKSVKASLEKHFQFNVAAQIFTLACVMYANGFIHIDQVHSYYEQSWFAEEYKYYTFKMGKDALGTLLDNLGRRTQRVREYELDMIENSSSCIAIDGHAIRSSSEENDLSETGYKFCTLKDDQKNLVMGYDMKSGKELFSRMYRGSCNDKATINDLSDLFNFSGILFAVDRGFYSKPNLELFSSNDNTYIIPVPSNTSVFKTAMSNVEYTDNFYYKSGKKHSRIEWYSRRISETENIYVFRDIDENEKIRYNYLRSIDRGKSGYTMEKFEENKEYFGVYVLQSNSGLSAEEVFVTYKKRWGIETFYQYLKNVGGFNNLMFQDYYKEQGFAFIMLIVGQIHTAMISAVKELNDNTTSIRDILIMARCMKMERRGDMWSLKNIRSKDLATLEKLGFVPQRAVKIS